MITQFRKVLKWIISSITPVLRIGRVFSTPTGIASVSVTCVCPGPTSTGFAKAANMRGMNFFTLTKPATAYQLATYAYRKMKQGRTLAYHGYLTKAGAAAERLLPTQPASRIIQEATQRVSLAADHICRNTKSRTLFIKREALFIC